MQIQTLQESIKKLKLSHIAQHHETIAEDAAKKSWTHLEFLERLIQGEISIRKQHALKRRVQKAHLPVIKTLDQYLWNWPSTINQQEIMHTFRLGFLEKRTNVIFLGSVGIGKTHLATALAYTACQHEYSTLFTTAIEAVNNLVAAHAQQRLKNELNKYLSPQLLVLDELGYLPLDKTGADMLFQIISQRYEKASTIITTNKPFKQWATIFNNDAGIASAILDRLLHNATTIVIEGKSYRMKDRI